MYGNIKSVAHGFLVFFALFTSSSYALASDIRLLSNISYGESKEQVLDVYHPSVKREGAPVIFMVHGGAWRIGDKASKAVIKNKVAHWVPKGFVFISVNYRMLPKTRPIEQAEDIKKAILFSQQKVHEWGGSSGKFVLMGHSAGAHLASLVSAGDHGRIKPWLGTVALDSAAYDIPKIMNSPSPKRFYKKAFGKSRAYWKEASPIHVLSGKLFPFLAVCSSKRKDDSCLQAKSFIEKAKSYGSHTQLLRFDFSHRNINVELGKDFCYTRQVDEFIKELDTSIESMLTSQSTRTKKSCAGI